MSPSSFRPCEFVSSSLFASGAGAAVAANRRGRPRSMAVISSWPRRHDEAQDKARFQRQSQICPRPRKAQEQVPKRARVQPQDRPCDEQPEPTAKSRQLRAKSQEPRSKNQESRAKSQESRETTGRRRGRPWCGRREEAQIAQENPLGLLEGKKRSLSVAFNGTGRIHGYDTRLC